MAAPLIHLDTGFLIRAVVRSSAEGDELRRWISGGARIGVSAIAWSEFLCGPVDELSRELAVEMVVEPQPFLAADCGVTADFFNVSGRRRGILRDCMIAATAVRVGAALATTNPSDFRKITGLVINPKL
jgi:predicted nucleic acid-binding protein